MIFCQLRYKELVLRWPQSFVHVHHMLNQIVLDLESSRTSDVMYVRDGSRKKSLLRFCYCVLLILTNEKETDKNKILSSCEYLYSSFYSSPARQWYEHIDQKSVAVKKGRLIRTT